VSIALSLWFSRHFFPRSQEYVEDAETLLDQIAEDRKAREEEREEIEANDSAIQSFRDAIDYSKNLYMEYVGEDGVSMRALLQRKVFPRKDLDVPGLKIRSTTSKYDGNDEDIYVCAYDGNGLLDVANAFENENPIAVWVQPDEDPYADRYEQEIQWHELMDDVTLVITDPRWSFIVHDGYSLDAILKHAVATGWDEKTWEEFTEFYSGFCKAANCGLDRVSSVDAAKLMTPLFSRKRAAWDEAEGAPRRRKTR
jgi:hypothetical protein